MIPFASRLLPAPVNSGYNEPDHWIWCGSVIRGDEGQYHMFASRWTKAVPFNPNCLINSRVVRAISPTPEGPYTYVEDVLPPRGAQNWDGRMTHNPTIHRWLGTYLLYYTGTGTTYVGPQPFAGAISLKRRRAWRRPRRFMNGRSIAMKSRRFESTPCTESSRTAMRRQQTIDN